MQAFRFEADPNNACRSALASHAGAARFAYNWALGVVKARLSQREHIREAALGEGLGRRTGSPLVAPELQGGGEHRTVRPGDGAQGLG